MAIQTYEKLYEGNPVRRATPNLITLFWPKSGTLKRIKVVTVVGGFKTWWYFNVRNNGTPLLSGIGLGDSTYIGIHPSFQLSDQKPVNVAVVEDQLGIVDLVRVGLGQMSSPIAFIFDIEDGTFITETVEFTTASTANNATATGTVAIAKDFKLKKITVSHNCRLRLYKTAAARTADLSRAFDDRSYRGHEHKMIVDVQLNGTTGLEWTCSPDVLGSNDDSPITSDIYYSVTNNSGGAAAIDVDLEVLKLEE